MPRPRRSFPDFVRYAIYATPAPGPLADFGASWLGWDMERGEKTPHPEVAALTEGEIAATTNVPRRYGFHATLKPPFRLAADTTPAALQEEMASLAASVSPVILDGGLRVSAIGEFLALVPAQPSQDLRDLAAKVVTTLDHHRAPLSPADRARRNPDRLTPAQRENLDRWGYPWVIDEFRFHITLTGPLTPAQITHLLPVLRQHVTPMLPRPFLLDALTLCGEDGQGRFHQIERLPIG